MRRLYKLLVKLLIVSMIWVPFSVQSAMVGSDQVAASVPDRVNRDKVLNFISRGDVAKQFESLGLSASTAKERVNAMTQDEINRLAGRIDALPAGGDSTAAWVAGIIIVGIIIWLVWYQK